MSRTDILLSLFAGMSCLGAVAAATGAKASDADGAVRAQLREMARRKIFFGHNSVGASIVDGVRQLADREGVALQLVEISGPATVPAPGITHAWVPENRNPVAKLENFARALASTDASPLDVALVKLCYVDFTPQTDVRALFSKYQETVAELKAKHPRTAFVHATAPLTTVQRGPRAWAKQITGKAPRGLVENARREEYNALLREAYGGREPVFDIARVESTRPDGSRETSAWGGRAIPALVEAYTEDGGHLNAEGRARAARELVAVLASTPGRPAVVAPGSTGTPGAGARPSTR